MSGGNVRQGWEGLPPHGDEVPELWGQTHGPGRQVPGKVSRNRDCPGQAKRHSPRENSAADAPSSNLQLWRISPAELGPRR